MGIRSIRIKSILQAHEQSLGRTIPLCKTSANFVYATTHLEKNKVYLQRGYKTYGLTHPQTLKAMTVNEDKCLDYHMNKKRYLRFCNGG